MLHRFASFVFLCLTALLTSPALAQDSNHFVVLELFTSQGCSSCPPADRLLQEYSAHASKTKSPIYPLSYHVDYWNYLGWDDPYSNQPATQRQYRYSKALSRKGVYTPQLIVNGHKNVVGSQGGKVRKVVNSELQVSRPQSLKLLNVEVRDNKVYFATNKKDFGKGLELFVAITEDRDANKVASGENRGETLSHIKVVRQMRIIKLPLSTEKPLHIGIPEKVNKKNASLTAFIQETISMEILAATSMALPLN